MADLQQLLKPEGRLDEVVLHVRPWRDDAVDQAGFDPRSPYAEDFWLPVLGPSTLWLLRRFAAGFDYSPEGFDLDLAETARSLGLSERAGRGSPFLRALNRTVGFGMAKLTGPEELSVRRRVPPLNNRQVGHLSPALQERHAAWRASRPVTAGLAESAPAVQRGPARPPGQDRGRPDSSPSLDAQLSRQARPSAGRAEGFGR